MSRAKKNNVLPGFGLTCGYTLTYLGLVVLIPLATLFLRTASLTWEQFWTTVTGDRALFAYKLTIGASMIAALVNAVFGLLTAWVLVRYRFPGRGILDALVDLPFALPTAVAGISLCALYAPGGWVGALLQRFGVQAAYAPLGIVIAMVFVSLPFVVRTVQPVLADLDQEVEEAAASLGARRWQTLRRVVFPAVLPSLLTGLALAFGRSLGEFGSIVFISGNMPGRTEIASLLILTRLEEFDYAGATAIAVVMLGLSFAMIFVINVLQAWSRRGAD
ncbi:MAG: sulfate ABC transporter permease subunit CysT [Phycisphaerales bacterium]|nr:sulfate ABC transporter permease subunit CysT [Phycisphaerales bacterium]